MGKRVHGLRYEPEYTIWLNMKSRCYNKRNKSYMYYGGRGIAICNRWRDNFALFYKDMCPRPSSNHQLDRKDNNKNYSPENCRWVERIDNVRNRKDSKWWFINGVKYESLGHASSELNVRITTIKRWCEGRSDGGYIYPPKENCWSERKYK